MVLPCLTVYNFDLTRKILNFFCVFFQVSDEILHRKPDLESCYIAAQTMRNKIQTRFHEVPQDSRTSLRDSLIEHLLNVDEQTSSAILTQLALALADLILLMSEWNSAINETIQRLKGAKPWVLLEVLVVLPEEVSSRLLRLGANRRNEVIEELKQNAIQVDDFLKACVSQNAQRYLIFTSHTSKCSYISNCPNKFF